MDSWVPMAVTIVTTAIASTGFWSYIQAKDVKKSANTQMLIGLGHDRIMTLGLAYLDRGSISRDEYENLNDYLYEPYVRLGGNGSAKKIMEEVNKLPIRVYSV